MKKEKTMKICFAASTGGHFEQLMMLKPLMEKYDSFILTEETRFRADDKDRKIYYLKQVNRKEISMIWNMLYNVFYSLKILLVEKPDMVVCTGVLAMVPMCLLAKLTGKKLLYIESFAKITSPTKTGKFLYRFADQFYVQWQPMLKFFPKAKYMGGIY